MKREINGVKMWVEKKTEHKNIITHILDLVPILLNPFLYFLYSLKFSLYIKKNLHFN